MGTRRRLRFAPLVAVLAAVALAATGCGSSGKSKSTNTTTASRSSGFPSIPKGAIVVGQIYPLSGTQAAFGKSASAATGLYVQELNAAGGIDGHKVKLESGDDQGDPSIGVTEAQRLITQQHISVMLEPGFTAEALQIVPLLTKLKIPAIAPLPTDSLNDPAKYPYYFDVYPLDTQIGAEMVKYAKTLGVTKLGVARDSTPYGDSYMPTIKSEAQKLGISIAATASFDPTAVDVTTQLRQLKDAGANGVAILSVGPVVGHVYQAVQSLDWSPKIVGTGSLDISGVTSIGTLAPNTFYGCAIGAQPDGTVGPGIRQEVAKLNAKLGPNPRQQVATLYGRDSLYMLKKVVEKYHTLDPNAIKKGLEELTDFSATDPSLHYTFSKDDHNGIPDAEVRMCNLSTLGPEGVPVFAPNS